MIRIPGALGKDLCDNSLGLTRRDILRVGASGMLGMSLGGMLEMQASQEAKIGGPGWAKAKSIIMIYLQGGPSHLDLWDPKENVPDNVRSIFKPIPTKIPGIHYTELLPKLAKVNDKFTMIRSMSYTPNGLFNHTAAIYQMMTGYTTDKVSPSGQLEPPSPKDFPNFGSNIVRLKPPSEPMLPFVMLPRPLQESNVVGKGGSAGFLGKSYDPYTLYPPGSDMDMAKMSKIRVDDLQLRPDIYAQRLKRRASLRDTINASMPDVDKAVAAAKAAFDGGWGTSNPTDRGKLLCRLADIIDREAERLGRLEVRDNGKLLAEMGSQTKYIGEWYRYFGGLADKIEGTVIPTDKPNMFNFTRYEPFGVVGLITPWNSPLLLVAYKLAPALAAGNTAVITTPSGATTPPILLVYAVKAAFALQYVTGP